MKRILVVLFAIVLFASCNRVSGTYVNESGGLYEQIEFVGKTSCTITATRAQIYLWERVSSTKALIER